MRYAVKYRYSDLGVVDAWKGPDEVHEHNARGEPLFVDAKQGPGLTVRTTLARLLRRPEPRFKPKMVNPVTQLLTTTQGALEISEAEYARLGPITDSEGRLRWRVDVSGLVAIGPEDPPLWCSGGPITDAPMRQTGELHFGRAVKE